MTMRLFIGGQEDGRFYDLPDWMESFVVEKQQSIDDLPHMYESTAIVAKKIEQIRYHAQKLKGMQGQRDYLVFMVEHSPECVIDKLIQGYKRP